MRHTSQYYSGLNISPWSEIVNRRPSPYLSVWSKRGQVWTPWPQLQKCRGPTSSPLASQRPHQASPWLSSGPIHQRATRALKTRRQTPWRAYLTAVDPRRKPSLGLHVLRHNGSQPRAQHFKGGRKVRSSSRNAQDVSLRTPGNFRIHCHAGGEWDARLVGPTGDQICQRNRDQN